MKNWKKIKLGEVLTESRIVSEKPDSNKRLSVRLNTKGITKRAFSKDKKGATKYFIRSKGQFIYGRQNLHKGAFGIVPDELDGYESSADIPAFDVDKSCLPEWIYYFFKKGNFYLKLESIARGVGSKRINTKQIFDLDILLPSLPEQRRILNQITELSRNHNEAKKEFDKQLDYLSRLRDTIIEDAVTGKLSFDWRVGNKNVISVEKIIENQKYSIGIENVKPDVSYNIPDSWRLSTLGDLTIKIEAGKSPKCDPFPAQENEWGVIKISAVSWGKFKENENKRLPINIKPFIDKEVKSGDFIFSRSNTPELVGRSVVVGRLVRKRLLLNDKTLRFFFKENILPEYINIFNNSTISRSYYLTVLTGTSDSMKNISRENIKNLPIGIPPFEEQVFITSKVNELMFQCDKLERETYSNIKNVQSILHSSLIKILGGNTNVFKVVEKVIEKKNPEREIKFDRKTTNMDLVEILKKHTKLHAADLWKMSKFPDEIDKFYAELKLQIEIKNTIKEVLNEKGYLELV